MFNSGAQSQIGVRIGGELLSINYVLQFCSFHLISLQFAALSWTSLHLTICIFYYRF